MWVQEFLPGYNSLCHVMSAFLSDSSCLSIVHLLMLVFLLRRVIIFSFSVTSSAVSFLSSCAVVAPPATWTPIFPNTTCPAAGSFLHYPEARPSIHFDPHGQSRKLRIQRVQDGFKRKCQQATSQEMSFNCRLNCHDMNKLSHAGHPSILAHQAHGQFLMLLAHDFIHVCCQHSHAVSQRSNIIKSITQANNSHLRSHGQAHDHVHAHGCPDPHNAQHTNTQSREASPRMARTKVGRARTARSVQRHRELPAGTIALCPAVIKRAKATLSPQGLRKIPLRTPPHPANGVCQKL